MRNIIIKGIIVSKYKGKIKEMKFVRERSLINLYQLYKYWFIQLILIPSEKFNLILSIQFYE